MAESSYNGSTWASIAASLDFEIKEESWSRKKSLSYLDEVLLMLVRLLSLRLK